ncbi:hypothetical protein [Actinoplanes sp. NPDC051851]|uniref:hypothetical protein n=1 Tax=Actinoplanes sp. NPDC051851 TaxID=3154753 RepID=UPI0034439B5E
MITIYGETRIWFDTYEITHYIRTGHQRLAVHGGQIVFADTREPWRPRQPGVLEEASHWKARR